MVVVHRKIQNEIIGKWVGTPYGHGMAVPGEGVDCVHLVAAVLEEIGFTLPKFPKYSQDWKFLEPSLFDRFLMVHHDKFQTLKPHQLKFGDVALFPDSDGFIKHAGLIIDRTQFMHVMNDSLPQVRVEDLEPHRKWISRYVRVK